MSDAKRVAEAAAGQIGSPYVYGAWGGVCTPPLRRKYLGYNPSHTAITKNCPVLSGRASSCEGCKYDGLLAFDCRGFTHWALEQVGITISGGGATSQYNTAKNWARRGEIGEMPDLVCCVFQRKAGTSTMAHTGLHVGGGVIIHCSGEVKKGNVADSAWTHYAIPYGLYTQEEIDQTAKVVIPVILKSGSKGAEVKELQELLNAAGYDCGNADGIYGKKTVAAVKALQSDHGLTVDGIAGPETIALLKNPAQDSEPDIDSEPELPAENNKEDTVTINLPREIAVAALEALQSALSKAVN